MILDDIKLLIEQSSQIIGVEHPYFGIINKHDDNIFEGTIPAHKYKIGSSSVVFENYTGEDIYHGLQEEVALAKWIVSKTDDYIKIQDPYIVPSGIHLTFDKINKPTSFIVEFIIDKVEQDFMDDDLDKEDIYTWLQVKYEFDKTNNTILSQSMDIVDGTE